MAYVLGAIAGLIFGSIIGRSIGFLCLLLGILVTYVIKLNRRVLALESALAIKKGVQPATLPAHLDSFSPAIPKPARPSPVEPMVQPKPESSSITTTEAPREPQAPYRAPATDTSNALPRHLVTESAPNHVVEGIRRFFATNAIAKVGVILLFIGVAFLLKLVNDRGLLPIELRLCAAALGAFVLVGIGWRLRFTNHQFGMIVQSCGVGVFYLTVFAGFRLYQIIPAELAFLLLLLVTIAACALAVLQDSQTLATFSCIGGFAAPILTSTGSGNHVGLFAYYTILNGGILAVSWYKAWRPLNLVGFFATFVISGAWGAKYYQPAFFSTVEPFLVLFFLTYFTIGVAFAVKKRTSGIHAVDGFLILGVPFLTFAMQVGLVHRMQYGIALSAAVLGGFYVVTARLLFNRLGTELRLLIESLIAVGVVLITVAIPFAVSPRQTSAIWALEGLAFLWLGCRQRRVPSQIFGGIVQLLAGIAFLSGGDYLTGAAPLLNPIMFGTVMLAASYCASAYLLASQVTRRDQFTKLSANFFYIASVVAWLCGGFLEITRSSFTWATFLHGTDTLGGLTLSQYRVHFSIALFTITAVIFDVLPIRPHLIVSGRVRLLLVPILWVMFLLECGVFEHSFALGGWLVWLLSLITHYALTWRAEKKRGQPHRRLDHYLAYWIVGAIGATEVVWVTNTLVLEGSRIWAQCARDIFLIALTFFALRRDESWPFGSHRRTYAGISLVPFVVILLLSSLDNNLRDSGDASPLAFLPLLNPLDIVQMGSLLTFAYWANFAAEFKLAAAPSRKVLGISIACLTFVWLTALPIRVLHHYFGVPWEFDSLFSSNLVQATLSIFWSVVALGLMRFAVRRAWRPLWIAGSVLLGIVVTKLMFVDLANQATIARVVSFIGTGVLLLLVGYVAPIPPDRTTAPKSGDTDAGEKSKE